MAGPLLFNTSFIIDPRGEIILKHWKHNHNAFLLPYTSPCDVYDEFIRRYGRKALFPVVDTPLGRLGCLTCCECMFPELARCTVFNGAEVILHPTSEFQDQITETTDFLKIARAVDTVSYWVSANIGEYANAARGLAIQPLAGSAHRRSGRNSSCAPTQYPGKLRVRSVARARL